MSQLSSLVESQLQYHKQAVQVLEELSDKLRDRFVQKANPKISKCISDMFSMQLCSEPIPVYNLIIHIKFDLIMLICI